ncbi:acyl-phosphate glycerol 3-phosphate acyltransferase [candidate division WOR-3 bacterium RBG_13_43_14]|uniref:Glycerol-3-phosphate acyltransferase n=1 Tax=candidate division WOR-3 bacterium RBG_13_43_14 TaxID=1802590 RepID=A0A1F4UE74_UNCW3|nr:MAG: acyl-phosphate glycerol 3-phosphate acyltransferase [candidate division WOR-3 bacterium RBG_13_43_14]
MYVISFLIGFVFGIIPFAYLIGRFKGINLKNEGSGNIGATNLGRSLGGIYFIIGFLLDAFKGLIPVIIANLLHMSPVFAGAGAIIGHVFNPFFGFRGGKGVSTTIGVTIGILPVSFAISLILWLFVYFSTLLVSLASIVLALSLPILSFTLKEGTTIERIFIMLIAIMILFAHRANMKRLLKGSEPKTRLWKRK